MTNKTKTTNVLIPFVGFYESIASQKTEDIAFQNFISENDIIENPETNYLDTPDDLSEDDQQKFWDYYHEIYKDLEKEVATDYIHYLSGELGIPIKFESIDSPKQYNYTTDRLFVDVPTDELISLYNRTDQKILADTIKENHTSGPGFDSFYENDISHPDWQDPLKYDHNQWLTVLEAYIKQEDINTDELYYI